MNDNYNLQLIFNTTMSDEFESFIKSLAESENDDFSPPFNNYISYKGDMFSYLDQFFSDYITKLCSFPKKDIQKLGSTMQKIVFQYGHDQLNKRFDLIKDTKEIAKAILCSINQHYAGRPFDGFETMEKVLTKNQFHLLYLLPILRIDKSLLLYRVRNQRNITEQKELFHVPFEKRSKCSSERYSIPGYPSLYLSESLETAIRETNVKGNKYSASCFQLNTSELTLIDLSLPNRELNITDKYCLLVFYPLIVACGLKVKDASGSYKPEYIIPQDLFLAIRLHYNGIDGVSYTSTKYPYPNFKNDNERNYVLYVRHTENESGYSAELAKLLRFTIPYSPKFYETIKKTESKIKGKSFTEFLPS